MSLPLSRTARRLGFRGRAEGPDTAPARPPLPIPMIFEPPEAARAKWEYHTLVVDPREEAAPDAERLNALGAEGWLLAAVVPVPVSPTAVHLTYYFVRETIA